MISAGPNARPGLPLGPAHVAVHLLDPARGVHGHEPDRFARRRWRSVRDLEARAPRHPRRAGGQRRAQSMVPHSDKESRSGWSPSRAAARTLTSSKRACCSWRRCCAVVESALSQVGWSVLISIVRGSDRARGLPVAAEDLRQGGRDADHRGHHPLGADSRRLAVRIPVALAAGSPGEPRADVVDGDNRAGTVALARHLVDARAGNQAFYIAGPPEAPDARERRAVFSETLAEYRGRAAPWVLRGTVRRGISGQRAVREAARRAAAANYPTPSPAATTRWRSGRSELHRRRDPGAGGHRPSSALTTCSSVPCSPRR